MRWNGWAALACAAWLAACASPPATPGGPPACPNQHLASFDPEFNSGGAVKQLPPSTLDAATLKALLVDHGFYYEEGYGRPPQMPPDRFLYFFLGDGTAYHIYRDAIGRFRMEVVPWSVITDVSDCGNREALLTIGSRIVDMPVYLNADRTLMAIPGEQLGRRYVDYFRGPLLVRWPRKFAHMAPRALDKAGLVDDY